MRKAGMTLVIDSRALACAAVGAHSPNENAAQRRAGARGRVSAC